MISLDTETTGLDLKHGAKPFLVTICNEKDGGNVWWEWNVDPLTRQPRVPTEDLKEIQDVIDDADSIVLQNATFDVEALQTVFKGKLRWDWSKVYCTLIAGHLLASNQPHDLTSMALIYLGVNVKPYDDALKEAVQQARSIAKQEYPEWRIAAKGLPEMPSAEEKVWKFDSWLPRAVAKHKNCPTTFTSSIGSARIWWDVCNVYANSDSEVTLALFKKQRELLKKRKLWKIYLERLKVLPVAYAMKQRGITLNRERLETLRVDYAEESSKASRVCISIAKSLGSKLQLPKAGNNKSLTEFVFGPLGLVSHKSSKKTGKPSMDKYVLEEWLLSLAPSGKPRAFIRNLKSYRKRKTALGYLESYQKFWLPYYWAPPIRPGVNPKDWRVLYPSLNPTGSDTLRWSTERPNSQQVSKQEETNLRYCFGPAPGREWWSLDAKNIELRIPAYEAGETEMISLFEKPNEPPYFGSYHLLVFDVLHPEKFAKHGADCKKVYESTWYQWTKNGNFAVQYGAVEASGTADRAYHVPGAQKRVQQRFTKIKKLNERMIAFAQKHGYVETMPDKTVDPKRGYPLLCSRTSYNRVLPTVPLNYRVQGTAMWWMQKGMVRCHNMLEQWNRAERSRKKLAENIVGSMASLGYYMVMQVHDELVFDFPKGQDSGKKMRAENLSYIRKIQKLMEQGGDDIGVPTPVSVTYHSETWSEGVSV